MPLKVSHSATVVSSSSVEPLSTFDGEIRINDDKGMVMQPFLLVPMFVQLTSPP